MVADLEKAEGGWGRLEPEKVVGFQCGSNMVSNMVQHRMVLNLLMILVCL